MERDRRETPGSYKEIPMSFRRRRERPTKDLPNLVLARGPHVGKTWFQVWKTDPDYVNRLANLYVAAHCGGVKDLWARTTYNTRAMARQALIVRAAFMGW